MANEKRDKHYAQRAMNRCLIHIGVLMVVGLGIVTQMHPEITSEGPDRCPKCGTPLPMMRREASSKYEERFHCERCHVTWTTGVFPGDG